MGSAFAPFIHTSNDQRQNRHSRKALPHRRLAGPAGRGLQLAPRACFSNPTTRPMTNFTVGYFVGSLSSTSLNRKLSQALIKLAPKELEFREIPIRELPLYSSDYDTAYPPVGVSFKEQLAAVDAVLFVTPEYNRSIPGALKNAIDWASRPYGKNSFARKPSAVIGTSPGRIGTAVAQQHLRSILSFCNSPQMNAIEAYIQFTPGLVNDNGEVTDASVEEFLANYMKEFAGFIGRVYTAIPRQSGPVRA
jgi:chromate reductase